MRSPVSTLQTHVPVSLNHMGPTGCVGSPRSSSPKGTSVCAGCGGHRSLCARGRGMEHRRGPGGPERAQSAHCSSYLCACRSVAPAAAAATWAAMALVLHPKTCSAREHRWHRCIQASAGQVSQCWILETGRAQMHIA